MSAETGPSHDRWRDLLRPSYEYPEDLRDVDPGLSRTAARRTVRSRKRQWRRDDHAARQAFLERQRRQEDVSPEGRLGCALVVAAVALVMMLGAAVRGATADHDDPAVAPTSSTTSVAEQTAPSVAPEASAPTSTATAAAPAAVVEPEDVVRTWATAWFTYTPTTGDTQGKKLDRVTDLMTDELTAYLDTEDPSATYYEANGVDATVTAVTVSVPEPGTAPSDHDLRLTRVAEVTSTYTAGPETGQTYDSTYVVTLVRGDVDGAWLVANFDLGDH